MTSLYDRPMDVIVEKKPPGWLIEVLERSEAQIAAGQTVSIAPVLDRLRASIARMQTGRSPTKSKMVLAMRRKD